MISSKGRWNAMMRSSISSPFSRMSYFPPPLLHLFSLSPCVPSLRNLNLCSQNLSVIKVATVCEGFVFEISAFSSVRVCVCLFGSRVVAENDFLHTLLNKVTSARGDSGGQGTILHLQALLSVSCVSAI